MLVNSKENSLLRIRPAERYRQMKSILSGVLRGKNATERRENCDGALRIECIELSRDESMGIGSLFGR